MGAAAEYEPGKLSGAVALDTDFEAGIEAQHADYLAVIDGDTSGLSDSGLQARGGGESPLEWAQNFLDEAALYSGGQACVGGRHLHAGAAAAVGTLPGLRYLPVRVSIRPKQHSFMCAAACPWACHPPACVQAWTRGDRPRVGCA